MKRATVKTYATEIKLRWPEYDVKVARGFCSTDRKLAGTRLIHPGKGRWGSELTVLYKGKIILRHNNAETYRNVDEIRCWIEGHAIGMLAFKPKSYCKICSTHYRRGKRCPRCESRR